jgi:hypothetical protein
MARVSVVEKVRSDVDSKYSHYARREVISMPRRDGTGPVGCGPRTGGGERRQ